MTTKLRTWLLYAVAAMIAPSLGGCARAVIPGVRAAVVMKKYSITPSVIRAKQGDLVHLEVTTADVQHGFDVPTLGIKESIQPGKTANVVFRADKKGEFTVECGVLCGPRHDDMRAKIVVE